MLGLFAAKSGHRLADADEVKRLLAELPAQEPAVALETAVAHFESLGQAEELRLDQRFELIARIDDATSAQTSRLGREYLTLGNESRAQEFRLWSQNRQYWARLAAAYEEVAQRCRSGGKPADVLKAQSDSLYVRLLRAYGMRLKWDHFRYGPIDPNIWSATGTAYLAADQNGILGRPVACGRTGRETTVVAEYLKLLLFQASSMDKLLPVEIEVAERVTAHLLPFFKLIDHVHPDNVCWVDPAKPLPPTRLAQLPEITPTLRFFGTRSALEGLANLRLKAESLGEAPAEVNLGGQYPLRTVLKVLDHLANCWAPVPPMRSHPRHPVKSWLKVVHGLENVFQRLSGLSTPAGVEDAWLADDVSQKGIGAEVSLVGKDWLRVGILLAVQPEGGGNWLLNVVRRIGRVSDSIADIGLETLSKAPRAVVAESGSLRVEAIVLDALTPGGDVRVVMASHAWDSRIPLQLALDGVGARLQPQALVERGEDYVLGRYRVI